MHTLLVTNKSACRASTQRVHFVSFTSCIGFVLFQQHSTTFRATPTFTDALRIRLTPRVLTCYELRRVITAAVSASRERAKWKEPGRSDCRRRQTETEATFVRHTEIPYSFTGSRRDRVWSGDVNTLRQGWALERLTACRVRIDSEQMEGSLSWCQHGGSYRNRRKNGQDLSSEITEINLELSSKLWEGCEWKEERRKTSLSSWWSSGLDFWQTASN